MLKIDERELAARLQLAISEDARKSIQKQTAVSDWGAYAVQSEASTTHVI